MVEAMVAEIDGWDDGHAGVPPAPDWRVLRARGRCPAIPKLVPGPWAWPKCRSRTPAAAGALSLVSAAHPLRLRTCHLV